MRYRLAGSWLVRHPTILVLAAVIIGFAIAEPQFLTAANLFNLLRQIAPNCIVATGMAVVMIAGGIDLSVGAMLSLAGVIAVAAQPSFGYSLGIVFALIAGVIAGVTNGLLVSRLRINAFISTLGVMTVLRGAALTLSRSHKIPGHDPDFAALAERSVLVLPLSAILAAMLLIAAHYLMSFTPAGRSIYAVGGSLEASRLAGLRIERSLLLAYVASAVSATVAGLVIASQINSGSPVLGNDTPLYAIAAVLLGGISMRGGSGSLIWMVLGVLVLGVLTNGLNVSGVGGSYQIVVVGCLLVLTVVLDRLTLHSLQGAR